MERNVLLISGPDQKGLIHRITGAVLDHGLNIIENSEYVDRASNTFFMRTDTEGPCDRERLREQLLSALPEDSSLEIRPDASPRLFVYVSDEPHCLGELLMRQSLGLLKGRILGILSQHEQCRELVDRFCLPFFHVPTKGLSRAEHEEKVLAITADFRPDYLVLARYMRILTPEFVSLYPNRIVNIHHSFLPAFIGRDPYEQAFARGVKIIGATAHFVNGDLDDGPIITQNVIAVDHTHDPAEMAKLGQDVEKMVLAQALDLVLDARVFVHGRRTVVLK